MKLIAFLLYIFAAFLLLIALNIYASTLDSAVPLKVRVVAIYVASLTPYIALAIIITAGMILAVRGRGDI